MKLKIGIAAVAIVLLLVSLLSSSFWWTTSPAIVKSASSGQATIQPARNELTGDLSLLQPIRFEPSDVTVSVARDYQQSATLTLHNDSDAAIQVAATTSVVFQDLVTQIVGPGSADQPVMLPPGESMNLTLAIFAPDAENDAYDIPVTAGGAAALVKVHVQRPEFALSLQVLSEDPRTLEKKVRLTNHGDTLGDLKIEADILHRRDVTLTPTADHARLPAGGHLDFTVSPVLYLEFEKLNMHLVCSAAGKQDVFPLSFVKPEGVGLIGIRSGTTGETSTQDEYCTNKQDTCTEIAGPDATGALLELNRAFREIEAHQQAQCDECNVKNFADFCKAVDQVEEMLKEADKAVADYKLGIQVLDGDLPPGSAPDLPSTSSEEDAATAYAWTQLKSYYIYAPGQPHDGKSGFPVDERVDSTGGFTSEGVAVNGAEFEIKHGKLWDELMPHVQDIVGDVHEGVHVAAYKKAFGEYVNGALSKGEDAYVDEIKADWAAWVIAGGREDVEGDDAKRIRYENEVEAHEAEIEAYKDWLSRCGTNCRTYKSGQQLRSEATQKSQWVGLFHSLNPTAMLTPQPVPTPEYQPALVRPGLVASLQRRSTFSRWHRGAYASPKTGEATAEATAKEMESSYAAAGYHGDSVVAHAWHQDGKIVVAAFAPQGNPILLPAEIGEGVWPQVVAGKNGTNQFVVAWTKDNNTKLRWYDGNHWQAEESIPGSLSDLAMSDAGKLYVATQEGLWSGKTHDMQKIAAWKQETTAIALNGSEHFSVHVRGGELWDESGKIAAGESPSLLYFHDKLYLAFIHEGKLWLTSKQNDGWSQPAEIASNQPTSVALAKAGNELRLTYIGSAPKGPDALWLVRFDEQLQPGAPLLMPSLEGNLIDASLIVEFALKDQRDTYKPHDVVVTFNNIELAHFKDIVPEGRYRFPLDPYMVQCAPGGTATNRVALHTQHMNGGHYVVGGRYKLYYRTAWSERFAFAKSAEEVLAAYQNSRLNHDQPNLTLLANALDLPVHAPLQPPVGKGETIAFPVIVANVGEVASLPTQLTMFSDDESLAVADVPAIEPGEEFKTVFQVTGNLSNATIALAAVPREFDRGNDDLKLHLWNKRFNNSTDHLVHVDVEPAVNDRPAWINGDLPEGAETRGDWQWNLNPRLGDVASHSSLQQEERSGHMFRFAKEPLQLQPGNNLIQYVYIDPKSPPQDLVIQCMNGKYPKHWIYWGESSVDMPGRDKLRIGDLPPKGGWVRLKVPVSMFTKEASEVNGAYFSHFGGRVFWGPTTTSSGDLDQLPEVHVLRER